MLSQILILCALCNERVNINLFEPRKHRDQFECHPNKNQNDYFDKSQQRETTKQNQSEFELNYMKTGAKREKTHASKSRFSFVFASDWLRK